MTAIQWTDVTDNIIVVKGGGWWCRRISPGCDNCYAAGINQSAWFGGNKLDYSGKPPELELRRDILEGWAKMRKPKRHFVASMTDVFGEWVDYGWLFEMLDAMAAASLQTFQVLTKRPAVMLRRVRLWLEDRQIKKVPANIWLGFSAENQQTYDERATHARFLGPFMDPDGVLWCSAEPLLERIRFNAYAPDWIVFGGESGSGARPCELEWISKPVRIFQDCGIPVFVKQLGTERARAMGLKHSKGGDVAEWPAELQVREFPVQSHF